MASTTLITRTPGVVTLPGAKGLLPPGTSQEACIQHNRMLKATVTALRAHLGGYSPDTISDADMEHCAQDAGVNPPGSGVTRAMIRELMRHFGSFGTQPYSTDTSEQAAVQSYGYWRVSYTDDLDRPAKTGPLVTPREVLLKLQHFQSRRAHPYTNIQVHRTTVVETSTVVDPITL